MKKTKNSTKNLIVTSISTLIIALVIASCTVYAWFLVNQNNSVDETDMDVVGSSNVDVSIIFSNSGVPVDSLKFTDVMPGAIFDVQLKFNNYSADDVNFSIFLYELETTIYNIVKENNGEISRTPYEGLSMLDVFAISSAQLGALNWKDAAENLKYDKYAMPLWLNTIYDDAKQRVVFLDNFILPGKNSDFSKWDGWVDSDYIVNDHLKEYVETNIYFKMFFQNEMKDKNGNQIKTAILNGKTVPVDINVFQKQKFKVGLLKLDEVSAI